MSVGTQQRQNSSWKPPQQNQEQLPAKAPAADAAQLEISRAFDAAIDQIESLLPASLKAEAGRFVRRAVLYFSRKSDLMACTIESKVRCVLDAAEMGLALDGKLCHAVAFNNKVKFTLPNGRESERWEKQVQCMVDYKGLIVVARRVGQIADCYADVVCQNDHFKHGRSGPSSLLEHTYPVDQPRGQVVGAYAILKLPGGDWRYDLMQVDELYAIRSRSKSFSQGNGPWKTDEREMMKKTVIRRGLKTHCDDPGVHKALELEDRDYEHIDGSFIPTGGQRVRASSLNDLLAEDPVMEDAGNSPTDEPIPPSDFQPSGKPLPPEYGGDVDYSREPGDEDQPPAASANTSGEPVLPGLKEQLDECKNLTEVQAVRQQWNRGLSVHEKQCLESLCTIRAQQISAAKRGS